jgi:hypothetical protein
MKAFRLLGVIAATACWTVTASAQTSCADISVTDLHADESVPGGITGVVTNTGDHVLQSTTLLFSLYDNSGMVLGNAAAAQMTTLAPGERWQFKAATAQSFSRFELSTSHCIAAR